MNAFLRKMTPEEFSVFCADSVASCADDLMRSSPITKEEALRIAEEEFRRELPQGLDTPDHFLMTILDSESGCDVGIIWYLLEWTDGVKQVFLSDLLIREKQRNKGYASAALRAMELNAKRNGCIESVLYVWSHNPAARALYTKAGYLPFRETAEGLYMKKSLC